MIDPILADTDQFGKLVKKFGPFDASLPLRSVSLYEHGITMNRHDGVLLHVSGAAGGGVSDFIYIILLDHSAKLTDAQQKLEQAMKIINAQSAQLKKLTNAVLPSHGMQKAAPVRQVGKVPLRQGGKAP